MRKKLLYSTLGLIAALPLLTGCKADDGPISDSTLWKGTIAAAPYASEAICLNLTGSPFATIEMTESGLYFITPVDYDTYSAPRAALRRNTRAIESESDIITGAFTILPDGSFDCKGFGIIKWDAETGTVIIELTDGGHYVWNAEAAQKLTPSALESRLCRTWMIQSVIIEFYDWDDNLIYTYVPSKEEVENEYIQCFTFSSSRHLYMMDEDEWGFYSWSWVNPINQILSMTAKNDEDGDGVMQVFFNDNNMSIMFPTEYDPTDYEYYEGFIPPTSPVAYVMEYLNCTQYTL